MNHPAWPHAAITFQPYGSKHVIITDITFDNKIDIEKPWLHPERNYNKPPYHPIYYEDGFFWLEKGRMNRYLLGKTVTEYKARLTVIDSFEVFFHSTCDKKIKCVLLKFNNILLCNCNSLTSHHFTLHKFNAFVK